MNANPLEDQPSYEDRLKFIHDEEARLIAAWEDGFAEGFAAGFEELRQQQGEAGALSTELLHERVRNKLAELRESRQQNRQQLEELVAHLKNLVHDRD